MTGTWPIKRFVYHFAVNSPRADRLKVLFRLACDCLQLNADLGFTETSDPTGAHLVVVDDDIDGPGGEVALTQEPTPGIPSNAQLLMRLDRADESTLAEPIVLQMFLHELGHFLGREHNDFFSVMQAVLGNAPALTGYDVWELQHYYGQPNLLPLAG